MSDGSGRRSYWLSPGVPVQFHFFSSRNAHINRSWVEALMSEARSPHGLTIVPEPKDMQRMPLQR